MGESRYFQGFFTRLSTLVAVAMLAAGAEAAAASAPVAEDQAAPAPRQPVAGSAAGESLAKPAPGLRPGMAGSFLSGRFAKQNKDLKEAARYISETLSHDPSNEGLQHEAMRMHLLAGNTETAIQLARTLSKNDNNDPLIASLLMLEAVKVSDFPSARAAIEKAPSAGLFGLIRPVMLEWIAIAADPNTKAVDLRAAVDKAGFFAPFINYHTALMNDVLGNQPAASAAYAKASSEIAATPYRVIEATANFYQRAGKLSEAQAAYDAYAKANPQSSLVVAKLTSNPTPKPLVADATQGLAELYFTTASILFGEDAPQETFLYLRIALALQPNLPPAQMMLASLYEQVEDYKNALVTYDLIPEGSVFYRRAQVRKALNYEALGQKDKAFALLDALASLDVNDATALITKGDMQRDAKNYAAAAISYSEAIRRTQPLGASDWPLLYARGISYERAGDWSRAEADFNQALSLEPNQPDVLNYLAYSWLTMNKNLGKARDYLENALAQRPDDAHIIDSIGLAYYLAGDYAAAVERYERAVDLMPDDATVNEHLGDAYWQVGRITEARYQWERALIFKPEKAIEDGLREKLANGLPARAAAPSAVNAHVDGPKLTPAVTPALNTPATRVQ